MRHPRSRWPIRLQPSLSQAFVSLLLRWSESVWVCEKGEGRVITSFSRQSRHVLIVLWPLVKFELVEMIGPMRWLELQAEWRTVWYGTRGKFSCLSHKACMLTLNSVSTRSVSAVTCVLCAVCCVRVSVCTVEGVVKSPAFWLHAGWAAPLLLILISQRIKDRRNAIFGSVSHHQTVLTLNKCIKSRAFTNADTVSYVHLCLVCMCCSSSLIKFCVHHSSSLSVSLPPSIGSTRGAALASERVRGSSWGSHTGGVFGVSWHLGERFQLIRDPCVHFDGFAGE